MLGLPAHMNGTSRKPALNAKRTKKEKKKEIKIKIKIFSAAVTTSASTVQIRDPRARRWPRHEEVD
jgi:hypothetical protein